MYRLGARSKSDPKTARLSILYALPKIMHPACYQREFVEHYIDGIKRLKQTPHPVDSLNLSNLKEAR